MSELIVAGYDNVHTAFLAGAALARMQKELAMDRYDVAVICREDDGEVTVREAIDLVADGELQEAFWKTLVGSIFFPRHTNGTGQSEDAPARLSAIGVTDAFVAGVSELVQPGTSAVLILAQETVRDRVVGVLQGFRGKVRKTRLIGQDRKEWLNRLSGH